MRQFFSSRQWWLTVSVSVFNAFLVSAATAQSVVYSNQANLGATSFGAFQSTTEWDDLQLVGGGLLSELSLVARRGGSPPQFGSGFFDLRLFNEGGNFPQGDPLGVIPFSGNFNAAPSSPFLNDVLIELTDLDSLGIMLPDNGRIGVGVNFDQSGWGLVPTSPNEVGSSPGGNWVGSSTTERNDFGAGLPYRLVVANPTPLGPGVGGYSLFETATATPNDPVINNFQLANSQSYFAVNFQVERTTSISQVGAYGVLTGPGDTVFAAIVETNGLFDVPQPFDLSGDNVVGTALLEPPRGEAAEVTADLNATLEPGHYALVFGSGAFGANDNFALRENHTPLGNWSEYSINTFNGQQTFQSSEARMFVIADSAPGTLQVRPTFDISARVLGDIVVGLIDGGDILVRDNTGSSDELAVFEFSLADLPVGRSVTGATLELDVNLITGNPTFDIVGYAGNGQQDVSDGLAGETVIGVADIDNLGIVSIDLGQDFIEGMRDDATHLGLRIIPTSSGNFRFEALESGQFGEPSLLTLELSLPTAVIGDLDWDGDVDFDDIGDFVLGLTNPGAYESQYGVSPAMTGDTDGDSDLDFDDIPGLVNLLTGGLQAVPEPTSLLLLLVGSAGLIGVRRRHYHPRPNRH